jgi:hypothetical protein
MPSRSSAVIPGDWRLRPATPPTSGWRCGSRPTGAPVQLNGDYVRDEAGQAEYLCELLEIFDSEGVDSTFVFLFALDGLPHRPDGDPRHDLDLASPGIVKMLEGGHGDTYPDMTWEPKAAFSAVAECYRG